MSTFTEGPLHAFALGPSAVGNRRYVVAGCDLGGHALVSPFERSVEAALAAFRAEHPNLEFVCEPALADLARRHGLPTAPLPEATLLARALVAFGMVSGEFPPPAHGELLSTFLRACAALFELRPWELFGPEQLIPVELELDGRKSAREVTVLGAGGHHFGLVLYDSPGQARRQLRAVLAGKRGAAREVDTVMVSFDDEPAWAIEALRAGTGLAHVPLALRVRAGQPAGPDFDELTALTAAIEAVATLADSDPDATAGAEVELEIAGRTAIARASFPDGGDAMDLLDGPPLEPNAPVRRGPRTERNTPCPCGSGKKYKKCHLAEDEAAGIER